MITPGMYLQDRYEILEQIGSGGMSFVFKAKDAILDRFVAIKVIKTEYAQDTTYLTKFKAEAQSAAALEHPNIVNIYDVGTDNGEYFIVMEYIEGITLKTYIEKKGKLTFKEATSIGIQVSRGIEAAHNKGIVHRDIKPQNIMISSEGKVKVTDFGIARATTGNTVSNEAMGSVHYISPEQARNGYVDQKSDIYSLGIVMFEMLTGHVPFDGDNAVSVAIQHLQQDLPDIRSMSPETPISIIGIIKKCTQKSPDKRYQVLADLILDLKKALMSPNENIVVSADTIQETKAISAEEMEEIRNKTNKDIEAKMPKKPITIDDEDDDDEDDDDENPRKKKRGLFAIFDDDFDDDDDDEDDDDDDYDDDDDDDDDDDGFMNPTLEKVITALGIIAGIAILVLVVYLILNVAGIIGGDKESEIPPVEETVEETVEPEDTMSEKVEMVNVVGLSVEEAQKKLADMGLNLKVQGQVTSETVEEGLIAEQSAEVGEVLEAKTTIYVMTSSGTGQIAVPNVVGYSESKAVSALSDAGFNFTRSYSYSNSVASGYVISQSPAEDSLASKGDTIAIVVSQGPESIAVPDVSGLTQEEANKKITDAGLSVGTVTTESNDTIESGKVISSSPSKGASVEKGAKISLVVSTGASYYSYNRTITAEEMTLTGCQKVSVKIYDANDNLLTEGTVKAGSTITIQNIKTETGYMNVEGDTGAVDQNGSPIYFTNKEKLTFTKQNGAVLTNGTTN